MSTSRYLMAALFVCVVLVLGATAPESQTSRVVGNMITGEGLPNPAPTVIPAFGDLPEGREWGSTAGIDISPTDGHVWGYERCGAGSFGSGARINCD